VPNERKPLSCNPSRLNGLSERRVVSHWESSYGGAGKRLNAIEQPRAERSWASAPVFEIKGRKREETIASGSMVLHEVYFDSLGGGDPAHSPAGATPLVALDMYAHSHHRGLGAEAAAQVDAFMQNLSSTAAEAVFAELGA
jgi:hypothetical protein